MAAPFILVPSGEVVSVCSLTERMRLFSPPDLQNVVIPQQTVKND